MNRTDLYSLFGLPDFASLKEIRMAYRKLALKHHPDRGGDEETMKLINAVYDFFKKFKDFYDFHLNRRLQPVEEIIIYQYTWYNGGIYTGSTAFTFNDFTSTY